MRHPRVGVEGQAVHGFGATADHPPALGQGPVSTDAVLAHEVVGFAHGGNKQSLRHLQSEVRRGDHQLAAARSCGHSEEHVRVGVHQRLARDANARPGGFEAFRDVFHIGPNRCLRQPGAEPGIVAIADVVVHHHRGHRDLAVGAAQLIGTGLDESAPQLRFAVVGQRITGGPRMVERIAPGRMAAQHAPSRDALLLDRVTSAHAAWRARRLQ